MTAILRLILLCCSLAILAGTSQAADIRTSTNPNCEISLSGQIVQGDFDRIARLIDEAYAKTDQTVASEGPQVRVCLNSPGGSLNEAAKIGNLLLDRWVGTVVDDGATCLSACAVTFMFGNFLSYDFVGLDRRLHVNGRLGFHQPALELPPGGTYQSKDVEKAFKLAMAATLQFVQLANHESDIANSTFVKSDLLEQMFAHEGQQFFYVDTVEKALRWEIDVFGFDTVAGMSEREAYLVCDNMMAANTTFYGGGNGWMLEGFSEEDAGQSTPIPGEKGYYFDVNDTTVVVTNSHCTVGFHRWDDGQPLELAACGGSKSGLRNFPGNATCEHGEWDKMRPVQQAALYPMETPLRDLPVAARKLRSELASIGALSGEVSNTVPQPVDNRNWQRVVGVASDDVLWIRDCGSSKCEKVGYLAPNQSGFYITDCEGRWCMVHDQYDSFLGWSHSRYMTAD